MKSIISIVSLLLVCLLSNTANAAGGNKHIPGVFIGATHVEGETDFTWGIEYEYKFNPAWGVGAVYEETPDGHDGDGVDIKVASLFYHPSRYVRLGIGFGEEKIHGDKPKTKDLYRISASYDFHLGDFGIAPTLAVDFIDDEEAVVFGVAIVRPF